MDHLVLKMQLVNNSNKKILLNLLQDSRVKQIDTFQEEIVHLFVPQKESLRSESVKFVNKLNLFFDSYPEYKSLMRK